MRLWLVDRLEDVGAAYNIPFGWRLRGALDVGVLRAALRDVLGRHEALRTVFSEVEGEPFQEVLPLERAWERFVVERVRSGPGEVGPAVEAAAQYRFDLSSELPFRVWLFDVGGDERVLLVLLHHIAGDGWSTAPLVRDLEAAYGARLRGGEPGWEPLPVQYADYTLWQRELLGEREDPRSLMAAELAFWRERLAGLPEELALPVDRVRPRESSHVGASVDLEVDAELHGRLLRLAGDHGCTVFMVVQAAVAALFDRVGAGSDIPLGAVVSGREEAALADLVGFFVNTVVVRVDTSGGPSFRELLERVRAVCLDVFAHQEVPFERVVDEVNPVRSLSRHPLFQTMVLIEEPEPVPGFPGVEAVAERVETPTAKFDLTFSLRESERGGMRGRLEYRTDLFDGATAQGMADWFVRLLDRMSAEPDRPLPEFGVMSPQEWRHAVGEVHGADVEAVLKPVHELFAEWVTATPEATALVFGTERVGYAELDARAARTARALADRGIGRGSLVGVFLERGTDLVATLLAVLKCGAGYTLLETATPVPRLETYLDQTGMSAVVTDKVGAEKFRADGVAVLLVEELPLSGADSCAGDEHADLSVASDLDDLACVMFTSGSTGTPKAVASSHRSLASTFVGQSYAEFSPEHVWLQCAPIGWDAFALELWGALSSGAVCVLQPGPRPDAAVIAELVAEHGVTSLWLSAGLFSVMVDTYPEVFDGVRQVMTGGEAPSPKHVAVAVERWPGMRLVNGYGPVESMVFTHAHRISREEAAADSIPLGGAITARRGYV
ncbi:condensation domain-containing protein, partial [Nocardiopsis alborubida]|uniref:condensation domain-containing protein n=1 Tax=Nocardiopsis alborubida TaxID=146802 RepID=UPI001E638618